MSAGRVKEGMKLLTAVIPEEVLKDFRKEVDNKHGTRWKTVSAEVTIALKERTIKLRKSYVRGIPID